MHALFGARGNSLRLALHIWLSLVLVTPVLAADGQAPPAPPTPTENHEPPAPEPVEKHPSTDQSAGVPGRISETLRRAFGELPSGSDSVISELTALANATTNGQLIGNAEIDALAEKVVNTFYQTLLPIIQNGLKDFKNQIPQQAASLAAMTGLVPACWADSAHQKDESGNWIGHPIEQVPPASAAILLIDLDAGGFPRSPSTDCAKAQPTANESELFSLLSKHIQSLQPNGQPVQNPNDAPGNPGLPPGQDFAQGEQNPGAEQPGPGQRKNPGEEGRGGDGSRGGGGGSGTGSDLGSGAGGGGLGGGAQYQSKAEKMQPMKAEQVQPTQPLSFQGLAVSEATLSEQMLTQMQIPQPDPERTDARKAQMDGFIEELTKMRTQAMQAAIQLSQSYQANLQGPVQGGTRLQISNSGAMFGSYAERIRSVAGGASLRSQGTRSGYVAGTTVGRTMPSAVGSGMLTTPPTPRRVRQAGPARTARRAFLPVLKKSR